jgi:hypothetical protein
MEQEPPPFGVEFYLGTVAFTNFLKTHLKLVSTTQPMIPMLQPLLTEQEAPPFKAE